MNRRRWLTLVGAIFTLGSLYLAFRGIHYPDVAKTLGEADYLWSIPLMLATLLSIWIRALRWKLLLEPVQKVSFRQSFSATMIGFLANNLLPMRLGEVVRAYAIGKGAGVSKSSAFATIVVERAFDLLALLSFLAVALGLFRYSLAEWVQVAGYVAFAMLIVMGGAMILFRWKRDSAMRILGVFTRRLPAGIEERINELVHRFLDGLEVLARGHHLVYIAVLSMLTWLAIAASFYFGLLALRLEVPIEASIVLVAVSALAVMLPSGPGFVGTFELGVRSALELFSVPENQALSYALFVHAAQFTFVTVLGLYYLWRESFSLSRAVEEEQEGSS